MRKIYIIVVLLGLFSCGKPQESTFFVAGNCQECKAVIEQALTEMSGVNSATWKFETSTVTVNYSSSMAEDSLQSMLAKKGFDTPFFAGNLEAKAKLPECCRQAVNRKLEMREHPAFH
ncbi:MAG: heavy-metal-associated domain-containing protein [Bacteroidia bacterium]